jgi:hypothetical protein
MDRYFAKPIRAAGGHFVPYRAFGAERQLVFGGLAVDRF